MKKIPLIALCSLLFFAFTGFNFFGGSKKEKAPAQQTQVAAEQPTASSQTKATPEVEVVEVREAAGEPALRPRELTAAEMAEIKEDMAALQQTLSAIRAVQGLSGVGSGGGTAGQAAGAANVARSPSVSVAQIPETARVATSPVVSVPSAIPTAVDASVTKIQEVVRLSREIKELQETLKRIEEEKKKRERELQELMARQKVLEDEEEIAEP